MKRLFMITLLALILTVGWLLTRKQRVMEEGSSLQSVAPKAKVVKAWLEKTKSQNAIPAKVDSASAPVRAAPGAQILAKAAQELRDFQNLKSKTFLSADEERQRQDLIRKTDLIQQMGQVLLSTEAMKDGHYEETENAALDFLIESLQSGDRKSSAEVIQKIILDPQVENSQLPRATREILAGIKAELLYHALALSPQTFAQVSTELPGPVTEKIWQNVQAQHQRNLAESQAEADEHQRVWSRN